MECDDYREALSAQLDGEDPGMDPVRLDDHLARCARCRSWLQDAVRVSRAARLEPVDVPDLTASVLARVDGGVAGRRFRWIAAARAALLAVAAGQAAAAIPALAGVEVLGPIPVHSAHELGAFNLAVSAAFGWTAWKPRRARAHLPLLITLVAVLAALTVADILLSRVPAHVETGHLLLVAGLALTALLARGGEDEPGTPPSSARAAPADGPPWQEAA